MKKKHSLCLFFIIVFFYTYISTTAQVPGFKAFSIDDNIYNSVKIFSLYKNNIGIILVGSTNGLYTFNGKKFNQIASNYSPKKDTITAIFQDKKNQTWVGYQSGAIALLQNGQLKLLPVQSILPTSKITAFIEDNNSTIWCSTKGEGIFCFKNSNHSYFLNTQNGLSDANVHALAITKNGDIIAATDQGLNICTAQKKITIIGPAQGLPDYITTSIAATANDEFWIGLQDKGICLYNHATHTITSPAYAKNWQNGQVNSLLISNNNIWIGTNNYGLLGNYQNNNTLENINILQNETLNIESVTQDNESNIWLIANNKSLIKISGNTLQLIPLFNPKTAATIHTIMVDHNGNYWAGTDLALLKYYKNGNTYKLKKTLIKGLDIKTDITSLFEDKFNNIWIGTMGKGIFILNPTTGQNRQITEAFTNGGNSILSITGYENTINIASLEGAQIFTLQAANNKIENKYNFVNYVNTIGSTYIYNVFTDSKQRTWFATDGKGVTLLYNGVYTHYSTNDGLKDTHIYAFTEDKIGNIWFSTSQAGIYNFDGKTFTNYGIQQGLSNTLLSTLKTDAAGNIIVLHKQGFDIFNTKNKTFSYVNQSQNIPNVNDDLGAMCTDKNNNIYIASANGIIKYTGLNGVQNAPITNIENVQLFFNNIDTSIQHHFNYDENNISFNFSGIYYTNPNNIIFRYKLEGLDTTWQSTTDNNKTFAKLAPGKYLFKVQSSINNSFFNASQSQFEFEIEKPIWKKWWLIVMYISIPTLLLLFYIKRREKHVQQVERLQGEKIKFEFEVLRNQINPHFLFNSFNTLISTIEDDPKKSIEYVEHLADFFRNIVNYSNKDTISLKTEVLMLQNYSYLQQKRYGSYLQIHCNLLPYNELLIPPLTLQLLVENAIKHNEVSKEATLIISIFIKDSYIVIQNNINVKIHPENGTGLGLKNIKNRYALLSSIPVNVNNNYTYFTVSLPIIK